MIKVATDKDAKDMKKCNESSLPEHYPIDHWKAILKRDVGWSFVYRDCSPLVNNPKLKGYIFCVIMDDPSQPLGCLSELNIWSIAVYNKYINHGIGSELLKVVIDKFNSDSQLKCIKLNVRVSNERAIGLYKKFGFVEHKKVPHYYDNDPENGEDGWEMIYLKPLT